MVCAVLLLSMPMDHAMTTPEAKAPAAAPAGAPNVELQRTAMKKLDFLVGQWSGEGRAFRATGETVQFTQTEAVEYKSGGLILMIEGVGRKNPEGMIVLQALALISFDDQAGTYHMRAFNDGRWLETDIKLLEGAKGLRWGFTLGDVRTSSLLQMTEAGAWTESHEIETASQPARKFMELKVFPKK
jgi:hypothetical protein